ncbi:MULTISPECIES: carbohydrate kinase family protein [unclassified Kribbella]|uniref:carbohydrate kinase family protein n=1 Tax=unclassified Kribbella TaxID=2644121 RepID=UPI0030787E3C
MSESARGILVCIGDLVEDIVVWPAGATRSGTDNPSRIHHSRGGSAANVAAFASSLGTPTRFIGRVGEDSVGDGLVRDLSRAGVDAHVQRQGRTGTIVLIVDDAGERTMYPDRAAAAQLADVPDAWISGAGAVHLSAYSLDGPARAVLRQAADIAHAEGAILTVDASSVALIDSIGAETFRSLVSALQPTYVFANGTEADVGSLRELGTTVVVKNGVDPTEVHFADGTSAIVRVSPVDGVRDTTGAGDAFAAGFLSAVLDQADAVEAVEAGHNLARKVLTEPGATLTNDNGAACD